MIRGTESKVRSCVRDERYRHEDRADRQEGNERMKVRHEDREGKTGRMIGRGNGME